MRYFTVIFCIMIVAGCLSTEPDYNEDFRRIGAISELDGKYTNRGNGGYDGPRIYLSQIIWPKDKHLIHQSIEIIVVRSLSDFQLSVRAIQNDAIVKEQIFTEGEDFNISFGRLQLKRDLGAINDNFAGATYTSIVIGLDASGHGKYRSKETFAGVALLIPMVAQGTSDVRFHKIEE